MQWVFVVLGILWILAWPTICIGCEIASTKKKNKKEEDNDESKKSF